MVRLLPFHTQTIMYISEYSMLNRLVPTATKAAVAVMALGLSATSLQAQSLEQGKHALDQELYAKARDIFKANTQSGSPAAEAKAYFWLGEVYLKIDKEDSAEYAYNAGLQKNPKEMLNVVGLGKLKLLHNKNAEAKEDFKRALTETKSKDAEVLNQIARAIFTKFDFKEYAYGRSMIDAAMNRDKRNPAYIITSGDLYRMGGESGKGIGEYKRAANTDPKYALAYLKIADLYLKQGNFSAAKPWYDQVEAIDPNFAPLYNNLADYYLQSGDPKKAVETFEKYLNIAGYSPYNRLRYGAMLYTQESYEKAVEQFEKVVEVEPRNYTALRLLAYSQFELGEYMNAKATMKKYFAAAPEDKRIPKDYLIRGRIAHESGSYAEAVENFEAYRKHDTATFANDDRLIIALDSMKRFDRSTELLQERLTRKLEAYGPDSSDYYTYYLIGSHASQAGNVKLANEAFTQAIKWKPDLFAAYVSRAFAMERLDEGDYGRGSALEAWNQFINAPNLDRQQFQPYIYHAYQYQARVAYKRNDFANARKYYGEVLKMNAADSEAKSVIAYLNKIKK